jgi:hypothetical protein
MEVVRSVPLIERTWTLLYDEYRSHGLTRSVQAFVAAVAEGYPFPLSLDRRPPRPNGMAPESEQDVVIAALKNGWAGAQLMDRLAELQQS